jgi:signal transduction histidine kinase
MGNINFSKEAFANTPLGEIFSVGTLNNDTLIPQLAQLIVTVLVIRYIYEKKLNKMVKAHDEEMFVLEKRGDAIESSISQVCHEMRNLVGVITISFEEIARTKDMSLELWYEDIQSIAKLGFEAAEEQKKIINNRLLISKVYADKYETETEWVDIYDVAEKVLKRQSFIASSNKVAFILSCCTDLQCKVDLFLFESVLLNLVSNARKFTKSGEVFIEIGASKRKKFLTVKVKDTGCGIPKDKQDTLFEKYYSSQRYVGTGLGLSFIRTIMQSINGSINLESSVVNEGSVFVVEFPIDSISLSSSSRSSSLSTTTSISSRSSSIEPPTPKYFPSSPLIPPDSAICTLDDLKNQDIKLVAPRGRQLHKKSHIEQKINPSFSPNNLIRAKHALHSFDALPVNLLQRNLRVAIVDDTPTIRKLLARRLSSLVKTHNWEIVLFENCESLFESMTADDTSPIEDIEESNIKSNCSSSVNSANSSVSSIISNNPRSESIDITGASKALNKRSASTYYDIIIMDENMEPSGGILKGSEAMQLLTVNGYDGVIIGCTGDEKVQEVHKENGAAASWMKPLPSASKMIEEIAAYVDINVSVSGNDTPFWPQPRALKQNLDNFRKRDNEDDNVVDARLKSVAQKLSEQI